MSIIVLAIIALLFLMVIAAVVIAITNPKARGPAIAAIVIGLGCIGVIGAGLLLIISRMS